MSAMDSILQRIATGPELSKDISREEAREGMRLVLEGAVDPVQAGVFLIALRMKRETDEENRGLLEAIREATGRATAPVDEVLDLGDPYDGYNRTLPAAPFLPPVLAACGVPTVSHGVQSMGPKYGVTHRQVLAAAGLPVDLSPRDAVEYERHGHVGSRRKEREQIEGLQHVSDPPSSHQGGFCRGHSRDVGAFDEDRARAGRGEPGDEVEDRALPGAARPRQRVEGALGAGEGERVDRRNLGRPAAEHLGDIAELDHPTSGRAYRCRSVWATSSNQVNSARTLSSTPSISKPVTSPPSPRRCTLRR